MDTRPSYFIEVKELEELIEKAEIEIVKLKDKRKCLPIRFHSKIDKKIKKKNEKIDEYETAILKLTRHA